MNGGKLIAVGLLFVAALFLFVSSTNISPNQEINKVDEYSENFTDNGTLGGVAVANGEISLSGDGTGTYTLNKQYVPANSTLAFDNVIVDTDLRDDNDRAEIRVFGLDRNGVVQESENIILQEGLTQYGLDERIGSSNEYEGYYFQIVLESNDNQVPTVNRITMEYDQLKPVTDNSLSSDLLAWLLVLMGIGLLFL